MSDIFLIAVEFGGYISIVKFIIFLVIFFLWLALVNWVHEDAQTVGTDEATWTAIVLAGGVVAAIIWFLMPVFIVGILFYLIAVGATSLSYIMHRDAKVSEVERVLTVSHLSNLFVSKEKKIKSLESLSFITANNNEVPIPEPKTPDFFGYKTAHGVFTDAIWRRASDIIFSPAHENYNVVYIVDGAPLKQPAMSTDKIEHLSRFLKHLAALDPDERRKPQKGNFVVHQEKDSSEWEVSTAGSTVGEQIKIKQKTQQKMARLSEIGLSLDQYEQFTRFRELQKGLFIVSGPQQSGVTTTFYSLLREHDAFLNSISTLEKQSVGDLPNITQNIFSLSDTGTTTYSKKLQTIVRMSPGIIGVADINDTETAKIACQAAKDGALVYATLEADSVVNAVGKWIKLVGDRRLIAETLLGVSNQRMFRKLCENCKQGYEPNQELLRKFNIPAEKAKVLHRGGKVVYNKRGKAFPCEVCQETGYVGRVCAFETIMINDELRKILLQAKSLSEISTHFRRARMRYLQERILEKVLDGTTSINEMVRIFSAPKRPQRKSK